MVGVMPYKLLHGQMKEEWCRGSKEVSFFLLLHLQLKLLMLTTVFAFSHLQKSGC